MNRIDKEIEGRRKSLADTSIPTDASKKWGLALSGGGIRSATFCFGLLRALAHRRLLLRFDLMSTVSGGGYIGSTVGSLFNRAQDGTEAAEVEKAIDGRLSGNDDVGHSGAEKPTSWFLWWLRANGRYLIPRGAKDTTFAFALYARNLAGIHLELGLIAIMLGLGLSAIDLVVWWGVERLGFVFPTRDFFELVRWLPGWLPTVSVTLPLVALSAARLGAAYWAVPWVQAHMPSVVPPVLPVRPVSPNAQAKRHPIPAKILAICAVVLALDVVLSYLFYVYGTTNGVVGGVTRNVVWWSAAGLIALWVFGCVTAYRQLVNVGAENEAAAPLQADTARNQLTKRFARRLRIMALVVLAGLVDRVAWLFAFNELSVVNAGLSLGFAAAVLRGLLPFVSSFTAGGTAGSGVLLLLGRIAGYVMTFLLTSWWVTLVYQVVLGSLFSGRELNYFDAWTVLLLLTIPVLGYVAGTGRNLGFLNLSSLHSFYRARLVRSYMGAANGKRFVPLNPQPLSALGEVDTLMPIGDSGPSIDDVWPDDDASLTSYKPQKSGGPVHLINVCVNQTNDPRGKLFNQDRKGLPLTVASGGLMRVSQDPWTQLEKGPGMSVGRWMAISGAAVAPGMGALTRGGAAALMTFAGVRLGYWWSESERTGKVIGKSPWLTKSKVLLNELFGSFKGTAVEDWFLTDGGHFENTGAYALLAERAEVIVVADCGADPKYTFGDLENLVRIARVDLQAEIRFQRPHSKSDPKRSETTATRDKYRFAKPSPVERPPELDFFGSINDLASRESTACLAMAKVTYGGSMPASGILILIKPNICSGLPVDLLNFKAQFPDFPQQPTSDQFFSEAQWESYFLLGQFLGGKLNRGFIERILATPGEFFEDDDCSPFEPSKVANSSGVKQASAAVGRLPARIGQSAVGATIGLGAVATVGVSTWQAIDSVRASYAKQTNDERGALKELTDLWAKVPAPAYANASPKDTSLAISNLAAAIVRTADTLCPGDEAKWYVRSPVAAQITNDAIGRCGALTTEERNSACSMLLEAANPDLKSPLPTCLSWKPKGSNRSRHRFIGDTTTRQRAPLTTGIHVTHCVAH